MSRPTTSPSIVHNVQNYTVLQNKTFTINLAEIFNPRDGSLKFYIKQPKPSWINIDAHQGVLYGVAPIVPYTKLFKITIIASNEMGHVVKSFILIVIDTDVVETMSQTLENILSLRKQKYGLSHIHPYTPTLIEYLYYFYQQPEYLQQFEKSVRDAAVVYNIKLPKEIKLHDFAGLIQHINPNFEKIIREHLRSDHVLNTAILNNQQLRNLFRMGSQPTGVIAIPVWNHCAYPDLYDWPDWNPISNVLDSAADAVNRLTQQNIRHENMPHPKH